MNDYKYNECHSFPTNLIFHPTSSVTRNKMWINSNDPDTKVKKIATVSLSIFINMGLAVITLGLWTIPFSIYQIMEKGAEYDFYQRIYNDEETNNRLFTDLNLKTPQEINADKSLQASFLPTEVKKLSRSDREILVLTKLNQFKTDLFNDYQEQLRELHLFNVNEFNRHFFSPNQQSRQNKVGIPIDENSAAVLEDLKNLFDSYKASLTELDEPARQEGIANFENAQETIESRASSLPDLMNIIQVLIKLNEGYEWAISVRCRPCVAGIPYHAAYKKLLVLTEQFIEVYEDMRQIGHGNALLTLDCGCISQTVFNGNNWQVVDHSSLHSRIAILTAYAQKVKTARPPVKSANTV